MIYRTPGEPLHRLLTHPPMLLPVQCLLGADVGADVDVGVDEGVAGHPVAAVAGVVSKRVRLSG